MSRGRRNTVCAAAITDEITLQVKRNDPTWCESARLWVGLVGAPSMKKTPIMSAALRPLRRIDANLMRAYMQKLGEYESLPASERKVATKPPQDEAVSGSVPLADRSGGKALLAAAKAGDTIVAAKLDRMFRSALDALQTVEKMKTRKVRLVLLDLGDVTGNGMAKAFLTMASAFAELERDMIRERVTNTKRDQRERGRYLGGKVPFGFRVSEQVDPDGSRHQVLSMVETDHEMIREIRQMRAEGKTFRQIQTHLEDEHKRRLALATIKRIIDEAEPSDRSVG